MPRLVLDDELWRANPIVKDAETGGFVSEISIPIDDRQERKRRAEFMVKASNAAAGYR